MAKLLGRSVIGFREGVEASEHFYGISPASGQPLEPGYSSATPAEIELAAQLAFQASTIYGRVSGRERGGFLRKIAANIEALTEELVERAHLETALPKWAPDGRWVARNPNSKWGHGYWVNHLMVPWLNFDEILLRQTTYDAARFKNECLGLPTALGNHILTREEIEACCMPRPMAAKLNEVPREGQRGMFAGVDWGGGGTSATVVTIGYIRDDKTFVVVRFEQLRPQEDPKSVLNAVAKLCGDRCAP